MCENNIQQLQVDEPALCFGGENAELRQAKRKIVMAHDIYSEKLHMLHLVMDCRTLCCEHVTGSNDFVDERVCPELPVRPLLF